MDFRKRFKKIICFVFLIQRKRILCFKIIFLIFEIDFVLYKISKIFEINILKESNFKYFFL